jgi:hypothetical protein
MVQHGKAAKKINLAKMPKVPKVPKLLRVPRVSITEN